MPDPAPTAERLAIEAAVRHVERRFGPGYRLRRIVYEVIGPDGISQRCTLDPISYYLSEARSRLDAEHGAATSDTEAAVIDVLRAAARPLKARAVASRGRLAYNSHLRKTLARMLDAGVLIHIRGGYWLAERPLPENVSGRMSGDD